MRINDVGEIKMMKGRDKTRLSKNREHGATLLDGEIAVGKSIAKK